MSANPDLSAPFWQVRRLGQGDARRLADLNSLFAFVFKDSESYACAPPSQAYLDRLLADETFIAIAALEQDVPIGGLVAYCLRKFEQARGEVYIYDLAVAPHRRRRGVATEMIRRLQPIARDLGAWVIFVQADPGDDPAIALYETLGEQETVLHFDIQVRPKPG